MQIEKLPQGRDIRHLEVVDRVLQLILIADVAVGEAAAPIDIVDAVFDLQKRSEALESVGKLGRDQVQINAATLLKISELRDFQTIQHDLPADAPGAEGGGFPVV